MKIVINNCYGGFGLSPLGVKRYLELKGKQAYFYKSVGSWHKDMFEKVYDVKDVPRFLYYCTTSDQGEVLLTFPEDIFNDHYIARNDTALIRVVEELREKASGECAKLVVIEVENGRYFKIDEYDGMEHIEYRDIDDDWMLAEE